MLETLNYGLKKPEGTDTVSIDDLNYNADVVDGKIKEAIDKANQAFQSASDGKQEIATAVTGKGVPASSSDTFAQLATKIENIVTDPSVGTTDAVAADVLAPKKVVSQGNLLIGTMPNNGPSANETINLTSQNQEYTIAQGSHSGLRKIKAVITGLVASVIKAGTTVGGILGTFTSDATAVDADVLSGKSYYRNGAKGTGSMVDRGTVNQTLTQQGQQHTIPGGKHSGSGKVTANFANLTAGNVKNGVNIGGVVGSYNNEGFNLLPVNFGSNALSWDSKFGRVISHYLSSGTIPYNNSKIFNDLIIFTPQNQNARYTIEAIDKDIIIDNSIINSIPFVLSAGSTQNIENITSTTIFNFKGGTVRLTDISDNSIDINYYVILSKPN